MTAINRLKTAKALVGRLKALVQSGAAVDEHTADQVPTDTVITRELSGT